MKSLTPDTEASPLEVRALWLVRIATALCFWGWAWQHLRWDVPYREILWNQGFMGSIIEAAGYTWEAYVGNASNDARIQLAIKMIGVLYILFGYLALTVRPERRGHYLGLYLGSAALLLVAYLQFLDKMLKFGQFIEYGSQVLCPVILVLMITRGIRDRLVLALAYFAIVCTFLGHGLYAIGYYEMPGHFISMTMAILGISQPMAEEFLRIAGALDFAVCIGIFLTPFRKPVLIYALVWGALTALARTWAGFSMDYAYWGLDQCLHMTLYRVPHAALPLLVLMAERKADAHRASISSNAGRLPEQPTALN